jgi:membrane protein implicated in regulation of membrane protease activity
MNRSISVVETNSNPTVRTRLPLLLWQLLPELGLAALFSAGAFSAWMSLWLLAALFLLVLPLLGWMVWERFERQTRRHSRKSDRTAP